MHERSVGTAPLSAEAVAKARALLGERIRRMRQQKTWSQDDASLRSGVSQAEWSRVELARSDPRISTLLRMQHALDAESVESLFDDLPSQRAVK